MNTILLQMLPMLVVAYFAGAMLACLVRRTFFPHTIDAVDTALQGAGVAAADARAAVARAAQAPQRMPDVAAPAAARTAATEPTQRFDRALTGQGSAPAAPASTQPVAKPVVQTATPPTPMSPPRPATPVAPVPVVPVPVAPAPAATAPAPLLCELALPLLIVGGQLLAIVRDPQASAQASRAAAAACGGAPPEPLAGGILRVSKLRSTAFGLPRRPGQARHRPLGARTP